MDCRIFLISRLSDLLSSFFLFSSSFFLFSSAPSFSGVAIFLSSDSLRSSTSSMVAIPAFFLLLRLPISLFLKGSRMSLRGMRLLFTMCLATLFRIRLPKLDRAFERIREVALAKDLNSSCFFRLVIICSIMIYPQQKPQQVKTYSEAAETVSSLIQRHYLQTLRKKADCQRQYKDKQ